MDRHEVDFPHEFGMGDPDVPGLRGRDRAAHGLAHLAQLLNEFFDGDVGAQNRFVADDQPVDVAMRARHADEAGDFRLVLLFIGADPGAGCNLESIVARQPRHFLDAVERRVGAHRPDMIGQQAQIAIDIG